MTLVAGFLKGCRIRPAGLGARCGTGPLVGSFAQQAARTCNRMGIVAIQAGRLPDRQVAREFTAVRMRIAVQLVGDQGIGVGGEGPGGTRFVVAGQADDIAAIVGSIEAPGARRILMLKTVEAQELLIADRRFIGLPEMGIVAGGALNLSLIGPRRAGIFQFELGFLSSRPYPDQGGVGARRT